MVFDVQPMVGETIGLDGNAAGFLSVYLLTILPKPHPAIMLVSAIHERGLILNHLKLMRNK